MSETTKKKHVNIPVFIPHLGCPNMCVFCNQRKISGKENFDISTVDNEIRDALATVDTSKTEAEIAFFGGSFTGIDYNLMVNLLKIADKYVKSGAVSSVRCSTRPDYINDKILTTLKAYNVKVIELGLQSISDGVLACCRRGHDSNSEISTCRMITEYGFTLVGQMMIGLPGASIDDEIKTAEFICSSGASGARIYPTIVFRETELADMYERGEYTPPSIDDAVFRCKEVMKIFLDRGVEVIRIGLCSSENLVSEDSYVAGPNHVAIGELVIGEIYYDLLVCEIEKTAAATVGKILTVYVPYGETSKVAGQSKKNKNRVIARYGFRTVKIIECEAEKYSLKITVSN